MPSNPKPESQLTPSVMHNVAAYVREQYPTLSITELITALQALHANEARIVPISEMVQAYPPEGAVAFKRSLTRTFGWFDNPNTTIMSVEVGYGESIQVPWGTFTIPGFAGVLRTEIKWQKGVPYFHLQGEVRQRDLPKLAALVEGVRAEVAASSIYKGKAIRYNLPVVHDEDEREHMSIEDFCPKFLPLDTKLHKGSMVFPNTTMESIEDLVFAPVQHTERFRRAGIQIRGGVIMFGPPGCGKTLVGAVLANECVREGWTYTEVADISQLPQAYHFTAERAPGIVFYEDIDRVMDRSEEVLSALRNTLDGVDTKRSEVRVILTSNFAEKLPPALIRNGRLGGHIFIGAPDADAAGRLLQLYAGQALRQGEDLAKAGEVLAGRVPAMLRDVVERAKTRAVRYGRDHDEMLAEDLEVAALTCVEEFDSIQPKPPDTREGIEKGLTVLAEAIAGRENITQRLQELEAETFGVDTGLENPIPRS